MDDSVLVDLSNGVQHLCPVVLDHGGGELLVARVLRQLPPPAPFPAPDVSGRKQGRKRVPTILEAIFDTTEPSSGDNQSSDDFENNDEFDFGKNQSGKVKVFDAARGRDVTCLQTNENFVDRFVSNVGPFMPLGVGMTHGNLGSGWWKHSSKIVSNT